ncbi:MAG TPA: HemK/PrmC family methyltransferase [Patescibacteria group bacterium]|jgi:release factor glutamine methyltransferase|nr:HemK/PrmC family methyltransferase [Patescibacteria group bacterium]
MNENSLLPTLANWLALAEKQLAEASIETSRLDALVLLSDELDHDKAWLLAHPEHKLTTAQQIRLNKNLSKRQLHMPLAYIRERKEFYGREFLTTNKVLIPRPETETLITKFLELPAQPADKLIDVGTGSGAIAITAKLERPELDIYATDISQAALVVATKNAKHLQADIVFQQNDLLSTPRHSQLDWESSKKRNSLLTGYPIKPGMTEANYKFDMTNSHFKFIVANLPYVSKDWEVSPEIAFEPSSAVFADQDGLALIKKLIVQAKNHLLPDGYLLLESDLRQHPAITHYAKTHGYTLHSHQDLILVFTAP